MKWQITFWGENEDKIPMSHGIGGNQFYFFRKDRTHCVFDTPEEAADVLAQHDRGDFVDRYSHKNRNSIYEVVPYCKQDFESLPL